METIILLERQMKITSKSVPMDTAENSNENHAERKIERVLTIVGLVGLRSISDLALRS